MTERLIRWFERRYYALFGEWVVQVMPNDDIVPRWRRMRGRVSAIEWAKSVVAHRRPRSLHHVLVYRQGDRHDVAYRWPEPEGKEQQ